MIMIIIKIIKILRRRRIKITKIITIIIYNDNNHNNDNDKLIQFYSLWNEQLLQSIDVHPLTLSYRVSKMTAIFCSAHTCEGDYH